MYEYEYDGLIFVEYEELKLKTPSILICGLPDAGLVGSIATSYLVRQLNMKETGGIESFRYFPPVSIIHGGEPKPIIRFFAKDNILAIVSETAIPPSAVYPLSMAIVDYAQRRRIDHIISPVGVGVPNRLEIKKPNVYWIATSKEGKEMIAKLNLKKFEEGYLVGPYAVILKESMRRRVSNIVLLAEAFRDFPDPEASISILEAISGITGVTLDLKPLMEKAEEVRLKTRELMERTRRELLKMQKGYEYQLPLMYT